MSLSSLTILTVDKSFVVSHFKSLLQFMANSFGQVLSGNGEQLGDCPPDESPSSTQIAHSLLLAFFPKMSTLPLPVVSHCQFFNHLFSPLHCLAWALT